MPRLLLALGLCWSFGSSSCLAQAFVEHLSPPVLKRGQTTRLTAVGSCLQGAVGLWTSLPPGKLRATPVAGASSDRATFEVRVADDAPVGVFGLRVATADGLSNLHLFLVDDLPVKEAPTSAAGPAPIELPCSLWGQFREANVDRFRIQVPAGRKISFEAVGNRLGKEVDPLVIIRDARGRIVAERDNDPGLFFDCRFEHLFAAAGSYTVELRDSRFHGHEHGLYVLRMGRFPAAQVTVPSAMRPGKRARLFLPELDQALDVDPPPGTESGTRSITLRRPGDEGSTWLPIERSEAEAFVATAESTTPQKGTKATVPGHLCGVLTKPNERHCFRLELTKGQAIHAIGHGRWSNSSIDLGLVLTDDTGRVLRQASDGPDDTVRLDFTASRPGTYCLAVRDLSREGGPACSYRIEVRGEPPAPVVLAEVEGLTVPRENFQPIPLTVVRNGHAGPIALTLTGAPPGVSLSPSEIPAGRDALVCKLSAGPGATLGLYSLQIWAQPTKSPAVSRTLVRTRPMVDRQLVNVDLIPYSLREDQRRLPACVSDRLALQVTEASPFAFELPQPVVTLPRYQKAAIPIVTTRMPGFDGAISFVARGGQLADKAEGRTRVHADFPQATPRTPRVAGSVHSRILANLGKTRIEVLASATHGTRRITLVRTFDLEIRPAFTLVTDPNPLSIVLGGVGKVRLTVDRVPSFTGPVRVQFSPSGGLEFPETVTIPRGSSSVDVEVRTTAEISPGRRSISLLGTGDVDGFEEETRGRIEIEVPRPQTPKKKK